MQELESPRFVSRLTKDTLAIILAGGRGSRLMQLTDWRAKPATPFGGKFRIIDFPLSNCMNSGIRRIGVLTQYKAHSLILHVQKGWGFLRGEFNEFVELWPAQQRVQSSWYRGTADAVFQNIDIIRLHQPEYVLILAGDHVYKMDYGPMLAAHVENQADMTVGCIEVPLERAKSFGVMSVDEESRIRAFEEKPANPPPMPGNPELSLASMGIYIFNTKFLFERLIQDADSPKSSHDFGKDIIPYCVDRYRVYAYPFRDVQSGEQGYWRDVGTVDSYWEANLELTSVAPELNLYDNEWPIWTYQAQLPPAKFVFADPDRTGHAIDSMVSGGCIISGSLVQDSLLFSNVRVNSYSEVRESVILPDVEIGRRCRLRRVVVDRGCRLPDHSVIGYDLEEDRKRYHVTEEGVVLVTAEMIGQSYHYVR